MNAEHLVNVLLKKKGFESYNFVMKIISQGYLTLLEHFKGLGFL